MRNIARQRRNPFGMRPPCPHRCGDTSERRAVFGFGNANADFHVIGDYPGVHGGMKTGIPFTGSGSGEILLETLDRAGFITYKTGSEPEPKSCFFSYLYLCCLGNQSEPTAAQYRDFERFFDAELRAISAHVLFPVGETATRHVLEEYTAISHRIEYDMEQLHGEELRGRGFLVVPIADPTVWTNHEERLIETLETISTRDYRQTVDLGRFGPDGDPYFVR